MDLQKKSFTVLQEAFNRVFQEWQENVLQIKRVQEKECVKYSDFVKNRADLRHLSRENAILHNMLVKIDLELQIRVWAGKND